MSIGYVLSLDSAALSEVFSSGTALKRAYEFCQPKSGIFQRDRTALSNDGGECRTQSGAMRWNTTFLDYGSIEKVTAQLVQGNGLVLHSALAIEPQNGQSLGLLSQNCGIRAKGKPPQDETNAEKNKDKPQLKNPKPPEQKNLQVGRSDDHCRKPHKSARVIHVFDREGDITEVLIKLVNISTPEFLFVRLITGA